MKIIKPKVWNKNDPRMPIGTIYVGRPTKWGNPFSHKPSSVYHVIRVPTLQDALESYYKWIWQPEQEYLRDAMRQELVGKHLCCWCTPGLCHADTILKIANG